MDKLKPCPFCGADGRMRYRSGTDDYIAECSNDMCPASFMIGWSYDTEEEAAEAWNRRTREECEEREKGLCPYYAG